MKEEHSQSPWVVTFHPDDSLSLRLQKAAHVKPSPAQLAWMENEYIAFVHYSPNAFTGEQWGSGKESVSDYNPCSLDVDQWCRVCSQAGMKMMLFTAKHHDGFCQWFTNTTEQSVKNSPVKEDIMRSLSEGCKKYAIELGVYLSPWDMYQREKGLWGTDEYNEYFLRQLEELLTDYGKISEVWFDGACGDREIWEPIPSYNPDSWYRLIERLQPSSVIRLYDPYYYASEDDWQKIRNGEADLQWSGKGVRWVGNESGSSRESEWSVQPVFDRQIAENQTYPDLGEESYYDNAPGAVWYPLEVNTTVLNQWFWNEGTSVVRSLPELIQVYYNSVGNNGVLLLNVSPDTVGVIPGDQVQRLMQLKCFIDNTFGNNLALGAAVTASDESSEHQAGNLLDGNKMSYWTTDGDWSYDNSEASITIKLRSKITFDNIMLQEFIREGQRVAGWSLEAMQNNEWHEVARHKTIGYKNIKRFEPVTADEVRLNILKSRDNPMLCSFGLYMSDAISDANDRQDTQESAAGPVTVDDDSLEDGLLFRYYTAGKD